MQGLIYENITTVAFSQELTVITPDSRRMVKLKPIIDYLQKRSIIPSQDLSIDECIFKMFVDNFY